MPRRSSKAKTINGISFLLAIFIYLIGSCLFSQNNPNLNILAFMALGLVGLGFIFIIYKLVKKALAKRDLFNLQRLDRETINNLSPIELELLVGQIYKDLGYNVHVSEGKKDHGIDVEARKDEKIIVVQCKRWGKPVGEAAVRDLCGIRHHVNATGAALVSLSGFTQPAVDYARQNKINLIGKERLISMTYEIRKRKEETVKDRSIPN